MVVATGNGTSKKKLCRPKTLTWQRTLHHFEDFLNIEPGEFPASHVGCREVQVYGHKDSSNKTRCRVSFMLWSRCCTVISYLGCGHDMMGRGNGGMEICVWVPKSVFISPKKIKHVSTCGVMSAVSRVPDAFLRYRCILSARSQTIMVLQAKLSLTPAEMMFLRKARWKMVVDKNKTTLYL